MKAPRQEIRFSDIDSAGHVNNSVYLTYFEEARIAFFTHIVGRVWDWNETGVIVARNEIDYLKPLFRLDEVYIRIGCSHIGHTSFTLTYEMTRITGQGEEVVARGASVLVCFNHKEQHKEPLPDSWRAVLLHFLEGNAT